MQKSSPSTCDGEVAAQLTEGPSVRPSKPTATVKRAKKLRRELTKPELMLWQILRTSPGGHKFRKQHPAGPFVLDYFCARANLAIEVDGFVHDTGDHPERDARRDAWLTERRIDTLRILAKDVLRDVEAVVNSVIATIDERLERFGKATPSSSLPPPHRKTMGEKLS
jgi:very-short-patch-repair endonuclease